MAKKTKAEKPAPNAPAIAVSVNITETRIQDLLTSAFEGGIGYWAVIIGYVMHGKPCGNSKTAKLPEYPYITLPLLPGGAVVLADTEKVPRHRPTPKHVERWVLDREAIQRGLTIMARDWPFHFGNFISENDDAETGDVFVQCCVLGDIVYG